MPVWSTRWKVRSGAGSRDLVQLTLRTALSRSSNVRSFVHAAAWLPGPRSALDRGCSRFMEQAPGRRRHGQKGPAGRGRDRQHRRERAAPIPQACWVNAESRREVCATGLPILWVIRRPEHPVDRVEGRVADARAWVDGHETPSVAAIEHVGRMQVAVQQDRGSRCRSQRVADTSDLVGISTMIGGRGPGEANGAG